jgi:hypothetical protein
LVYDRGTKTQAIIGKKVPLQLVSVGGKPKRSGKEESIKLVI